METPQQSTNSSEFKPEATTVEAKPTIDREKLAQRVVTGFTTKLKDIAADIRLLWKEFSNLPSGETILGCQNRKEFCKTHLHCTPRAVQLMLKRIDREEAKQAEGEQTSPPDQKETNLDFRFARCPDGHRTDEMSSMLQKSIRRGLEDDALFAASELDLAGFTGHVWNRLIVIACEDIGLGDPTVIMQVMPLFDAWRYLKSLNNEHIPQRLPMVQAVLVCVRSGKPPMMTRVGKSRLIDDRLQVLYLDRPHYEVGKLPSYVYDKHTEAGRFAGLIGAAGINHFFKSGNVLADESDLPNPYTERHWELAIAVTLAEEKAIVKKAAA
jgi:hypothetical protein